MKVLVACEFSGIVREAFRKLDVDAWSCDLLPTDIPSPYHIQDDVMKHLNDGWDGMIGHPDCTFLTNSGVRWLHKDPTRWAKLKDGISFFNRLKEANIPRIALENPIPHKYARQDIGDYTQIIQPYQFGHAERKATCLWLKNLPELISTNNVYEEMKLLPKNISQRILYTAPGKDRWKIRSKTFQGIADAMASQWSSFWSGNLPSKNHTEFQNNQKLLGNGLITIERSGN